MPRIFANNLHRNDTPIGSFSREQEPGFVVVEERGWHLYEGFVAI